MYMSIIHVPFADHIAPPRSPIAPRDMRYDIRDISSTFVAIGQSIIIYICMCREYGFVCTFVYSLGSAPYMQRYRFIDFLQFLYLWNLYNAVNCSTYFFLFII